MKKLTEYTNARVSLGVAGGSLPTQPLLDLRLAHARAKDAVDWQLDFEAFQLELTARGWPSRILESAARSREEYLKHPDLGRKLRTEYTLREEGVTFLIGDGLSAIAIERHAIALLERVFTLLPHVPDETNPILLVRNARVAVADHVGGSVTVLLIGERPGLSSPDSLGVYMTWQPGPGRTDADRNCISNIHSAGLSYDAAAFKLVFLLREMMRLKLSGVKLKDTSGDPRVPRELEERSGKSRP